METKRIKKAIYHSNYSNHSMSNHRVSQYGVVMNGKSRGGSTSNTVASLIITIILIAIFVKLASSGLDRSIQNQDVMLCTSAERSGNQEYLNKCQCYYDTEDITCLQRGGDSQ